MKKKNKESWAGLDFESPAEQKIREDYWTAVNILRDLASKYDRDEIMEEVNRDV